MIHQHTKAEFFLNETPSVPGDFGDNEYHAYDMVLKVTGRSADTKTITRLHVAKVQVPFGQMPNGPRHDPILAKYLELSMGDMLLAEFYPEVIERELRDALRPSDILSLCAIGDGTVRRLIGVPCEWLFLEMTAVATRNGIPLQAADTWVHSSAVHTFAAEIVEQVSMERLAHKMGKAFSDDFRRGLSGYLLEKAAYAHDFGRMYSGSNASRTLEKAILHGFRGARHFRSLACEAGSQARDDFEFLASVCETHVGGAGLTACTIKQNQTLLDAGIDPRDTLATNPYEKIVSYADWRIHGRKIGTHYMPRRVSEQEAMDRTLKFKPSPRQLQAVKDLCDFIHYITQTGPSKMGTSSASKSSR
jgi:hypothetical protein